MGPDGRLQHCLDVQRRFVEVDCLEAAGFRAEAAKLRRAIDRLAVRCTAPVEPDRGCEQ